MYLSNKGLYTSIFNIPTKLSHSPTSSAKFFTIIAQVVQVKLIISCLVQPGRGP